MYEVFGVPQVWFILIAGFWIAVGLLILGPDLLATTIGTALFVFFLLGTTILVGQFGWQILILPSVVILSVGSWFIWRRTK